MQYIKQQLFTVLKMVSTWTRSGHIGKALQRAVSYWICPPGSSLIWVISCKVLFSEKFKFGSLTQWVKLICCTWWHHCVKSSPLPSDHYLLLPWHHKWSIFLLPLSSLIFWHYLKRCFWDLECGHVWPLTIRFSYHMFFQGWYVHWTFYISKRCLIVNNNIHGATSETSWNRISHRFTVHNTDLRHWETIGN